ncbi:flavin-containing monooxygenase [Nocardia violaceofusca]|uniref:flavin-containing monooxygenase n=1 Tax=Nocardia violaceofusca TaxID=941182 RepID=UPI0007A3A1D6|nr:NAD(P)/FAD-dependent oxidoreductase [Nocardia violaceofusca]
MEVVEGLHSTVVVVGSGFGGIGMGTALRRAGMDDFVILEESSELGGVWRDNTYPGCNCDVPAHLYSFSFAPYRDTAVRFPARRRTLEYLRSVAAAEGLPAHLRTGTAVTEATYSESEARWELRTANGIRLTADIVVFAVGQLHRPNIPEIPGRDEFGGASFHTAGWDHAAALRGRRIALIGTGSSAAQCLPTLADTAASVRIFQRTPQWILPKPAPEFGPATRAALRLPGAQRAYRWGLQEAADSLLAPMMHRRWPARPAEWAARQYLRRSIADPVLRGRLTPDYPIGAKRIVFDSHFYRTLRRDNVELTTAAIARITRDGIVTADGGRYDADVIVYATGFRASEFLAPITVRGRGGRSLQDRWRSGPDAFMGLAVPGFPNAFLIAGPNSFTPAGSNPAMKEHQIAYIMRCLRWRDEIGAAAIEVRADAMAAHREWLADALATTVWSTDVPSWYTHDSGAITNPWPASVRTYARMLRRPPALSFAPVHHTATAEAVGA